VSRAIAGITRTYEIEVGFYNDLAPTIAVNAPRSHYAAHDTATGAYCVILDDLAPAVQGDQMRGCSVDEAALALRELPELHAPRWGKDCSDLTWLRGRPTTEVDLHSSFLASLLPGFFERYADRLDDDVVAMTERSVPKASSPTPTDGAAVIHNDFRVDNLMFGAPRVWVLDWQTLAVGDALLDVSYFLGGSVTVDDRRANEEQLVRSYVDDIAGRGVPLDFDDAWRRYRRHAYAGLLMAIGASMNVVRTDRGDDMFVTMANRAGRHILDLEAEPLLG
jgi:aminoglycoside/choline kinase family phosphotransferase